MKKTKVISEGYVDHKKSDKKISRRLFNLWEIFKVCLIPILVYLHLGVTAPLVEINSPLVSIVHNIFY